MRKIALTEITGEEFEGMLETAIRRVLASWKKDNQPSLKPLNIEQAADYTQCAIATIRAAVKSKELQAHRQAGRLYFFEADLISWIKN